jgi:hypothetical protein
MKKKLVKRFQCFVREIVEGDLFWADCIDTDTRSKHQEEEFLGKFPIADIDKGKEYFRVGAMFYWYLKNIQILKLHLYVMKII